MSGNIVPDSVSDMYAVVDLAKKKKKKVSGKVVEPQVSDSDIPLYAVVHKTKVEDTTQARRRLACLVLLVMVAVVIVGGVVACLIATFVELSALKSEVSSQATITSAEISALKSEISSQTVTNAEISITKSKFLSFQQQVENSREWLTNILQNLNESLYNHIVQDFSFLSDKVEQQTEAIYDIFFELISLIPASSCIAVHQILPSSLSGYYWVRSSNGSAVRVYCDMTRLCGNITGGWIRVAKLNMTNTNDMCPTNLIISTSSGGMRTCKQPGEGRNCTSIYYPVMNISYSHVCGSITGYQHGTLDGFGAYGSSRPRPPTDNTGDNYVDGISLTHGNPRYHIWTFAAGTCPCTDNKPSFVSNDFFCDGTLSNQCSYCNEILWDGIDCENRTSPFFHKKLSNSTSNDIEMRLCRDQSIYDEDIEIETIELYIQ